MIQFIDGMWASCDKYSKEENRAFAGIIGVWLIAWACLGGAAFFVFRQLYAEADPLDQYPIIVGVVTMVLAALLAEPTFRLLFPALARIAAEKAAIRFAPRWRRNG
jgi:hypothetical protein